MDNILIITAGTSGWLREHLSPGAIVRMFGEGLIGDYKTKMEALREIDEKISEWTSDLGVMVEKMKTGLEAGRLVDVALLLGQVDQRLKSVSDFKNKIEQVQQEAIREFERKREENLPLSTQAGLWDDFKRKFVHRRFRNEKQYLAIKDLINKTSKIVAQVKLELGELGKARASGHINKYLEVLDRIGKLQTSYHNSFQAVYDKWLRVSVDEALQEENEKNKIESIPPTEKVTERNPQIEGFVAQQIASPPKVNVPDLIPSTQPASPKLENEVAPKTEDKDLSPATIPDSIPPTQEEEDKMPETLRSVNHEYFIDQLIKAAKSTNDPYLLASMVVKFSGEVEEYDLDKSLELLALAEGILDA